MVKLIGTGQQARNTIRSRAFRLKVLIDNLRRRSSWWQCAASTQNRCATEPQNSRRFIRSPRRRARAVVAGFRGRVSWRSGD
jgi:hypothetical protein